jgi:uncharacterized protein YjdB
VATITPTEWTKEVSAKRSAREDKLVKPFLFPALFAFVACSDHSTGPASPEVAAVSITIPAPELEMGQSITAVAVALDQFGTPIDKGPVTWSSSFPPVAVVQPTTGQILAINSGMTQIIATVAGKEGHSDPHSLTSSRGATNICA